MTGEPGPAANKLPFAAEVAAYLADCMASPVRLDPVYHPTGDGAVKVVFHRRHRDPAADKAAEDQVRAAFRALTGQPGSRTALPAVRTGHHSLFRLELPE